MATIAISALNPKPQRRGKSAHRWRVAITALAIAALLLFLAIHGVSYYRTPLEERPFSPLHPELRSGGTIGLRLGMLGFGMFCVLFLYPLRKRWKWLAETGATPHWLDVHVVMGISAPLVITLHSAFKFQGLAGLAYWIMIAVALSGFVGRYVYSKIPRSLNSVKLSMSEMESQMAVLSGRLAEQNFFSQQDLAVLLTVPSAAGIRTMGLFRLLATMLRLDLLRPLRVSRLRRRVLSPWERLTSLGGLLPSRHAEVEAVVAHISRQSGLLARIAFLDRTERIFHLWHVIHRPFSFTFVALVVIHVSLALLLGYF